MQTHILAQVKLPFYCVIILALQISSGPLQHIVLALSGLLFSVLISCHVLKTAFANFFDVVLQICRMHMEVVDL